MFYAGREVRSGWLISIWTPNLYFGFPGLQKPKKAQPSPFSWTPAATIFVRARPADRCADRRAERLAADSEVGLDYQLRQLGDGVDGHGPKVLHLPPALGRLGFPGALVFKWFSVFWGCLGFFFLGG